jgi:hypothetical protein
MDSKEPIPPGCVACAGMFRQSLGTNRNRVVVSARQATQPGGIGSLESILDLLKSLEIRAGGPVRQLYFYSVPNHHRMFRNPSTGFESV